ncbi:MAG: molybdopterin molybdenumtransferase MoeA [Rhodospirillales bacterium]|nr:MAG: molybdopterin molybdenumtransferase MoeA [Rhodospirillales bacterium]
MLAVADAVAMVAGAFRPLAPEQISLTEALGRVLAEDVVARVSQPPVAVSAMDGYAVASGREAAMPATFRVVGEAMAGRGFLGKVGPGEAVRIATGAPIPAGADTIVIQEDTDRRGDSVTVRRPLSPGRWIRKAGLDFVSGDVLLHAGRTLTARDVGLLAAMNVPWLRVRRKPRIAVLATGDELVMPGESPGPDQIVAANSLAVVACVCAFGGIAVDLGIAVDDPCVLAAAMAGCRGADLLVTIGGASVGDRDLIARTLGIEGLAVGFHKVAMRPGKPLIFGRLDDVPVLGLPGNPVSAGVTALLFLAPAMDAMLGRTVETGSATAVLGRDLDANDDRQDYLRAALSRTMDGDVVATPFSRQDSALLSGFAAADCLVVRPPAAAAARAGDRVPILTFPPGLAGF